MFVVIPIAIARLEHNAQTRADCQFALWARTADASALFEEIRPSLMTLAIEPRLAGLFASLVSCRSWTDRELLAALIDVVDQMKPFGFPFGDPRSWRNSWYYESRVRDVWLELERRCGTFHPS